MAEANNLLGGFDPNVGMVQVRKRINSLYNGDHKDFAPRFGAVWDLTGKGTTVVRAGAGIIFNSLLPMQTFTGVAGNAVNVDGGCWNRSDGGSLRNLSDRVPEWDGSHGDDSRDGNHRGCNRHDSFWTRHASRNTKFELVE